MKRFLVFGGLLVVAGCVSAANADKTVELRVGQTKHIDAYRASSCGAPAPSFADIQGRLPSSKIVQFSDGGISSRMSNSCKRRVPTRAINGTGVAVGEEVKRFDNTVAIIVR